MKEFVKYLWNKKIKLLFLLFVLTFDGVVGFYVCEFGLWEAIGSIAFLTIVTIVSFAQVWKEWKDGLPKDNNQTK